MIDFGTSDEIEGIGERAEAYFKGLDCPEPQEIANFAASEVGRAKCTLNHFPVPPVVPNSAEHWFNECVIKNAEIDKLAGDIEFLKNDRADILAQAIKAREKRDARIEELMAELNELRKSR